MDQATAHPAFRPFTSRPIARFALGLGLISLPGHATWKGGALEQVAVFSTSQLLWPALSPADQVKSHGSSPIGTIPRIAIVPVSVRDFVEKTPCDSCDRLSPNVLEFFLPAWHRELLSRWTGKEAAVISSGDPLLGADTAWMNQGQSFGFPWRNWFDTLDQGLIYRPRDPFVSPEVTGFCSALGGRMGVSHLLFTDSVRVMVNPWGRSSHRGSFRLAYMAVFWNVAKGQPEWALKVAVKGPWWSDLNAPLEPRLEPDLERFRQEIPSALKALWRQEPR